MSTASGIENERLTASAPGETAATDHLRAFLAGRDVECPGCGYNLRDLSGSRCPECGTELVLAVGLAEPRQAALIAGLIALAAGTGLNGLLLGFLCIQLIVVGGMFPWMRFLLVNSCGFVLQGAALILWLRFWRVLRRRSRFAKLMLVAGCWLLTLVNLLVFSVLLK